jgi:hypothetical protein
VFKIYDGSAPLLRRHVTDPLAPTGFQFWFRITHSFSSKFIVNKLISSRNMILYAKRCILGETKVYPPKRNKWMSGESRLSHGSITNECRVPRRPDSPSLLEHHGRIYRIPLEAEPRIVCSRRYSHVMRLHVLVLRMRGRQLHRRVREDLRVSL